MDPSKPLTKLLLFSAALIACSAQAADPVSDKLEREMGERLVKLCQGSTCYNNVTITQAKSILLESADNYKYPTIRNSELNISVHNPDQKTDKVPAVLSPEGEGGKARQWKIEFLGTDPQRKYSSVYLENPGTARVFGPSKDDANPNDPKFNLEQLRKEFGGIFDISMPVHGFDAKGEVIRNQFEVKLKTAPDGSGYGVVSKDGVPVYNQRPELQHASFGTDSKPTVSSDNPGLTNGTVDHAPKK
jgi:hypothetical protein